MKSGSKETNMLDLLNDQCRWPMRKSGSVYLFCGCKAANGYPYCSAHKKIAYVPAKRTMQ